MRDVKIGALCWNQYTDWPALLEAGRRVDDARVHREMFARNGNARLWTTQPVGTPEDVAEHCAPLVELGYRHLIAGFPSPHDEESMTGFASEVRPILQRG
jgi:alkanesulfonate monooxygenase SsuD/methylene tetrahydromethanopterin reductase-like flavin-dependent oxidoreductase (luciferase family)